MWKLWHKLFGWDYVLYEFAGEYHIRRIKKAPNGLEYVTVYWITGCTRTMQDLLDWTGYNLKYLTKEAS